MDEAIAILREQTILCSRMLKLFADLTELLQKNSLEMLQLVRKVEPAVMELSRNADRTQRFLARMQAKTLNEFIGAQEANAKKEVAMSLLEHANDLQLQLRRRTETLNRLTENGKAFVTFNLNVLSRASTKPTYGAAAQTGTQSGRRLFDTNV